MFRKKNNYKRTAGAYISKIDKRLADFDRNHTWSDTQLAEIKKYKRIFRLRNDRSSITKDWSFDQ
ncbi:MAG: CBU_0585 family protein [Coxiella endosymbiont of Haemaphysalis qinghaiensis]